MVAQCTRGTHTLKDSIRGQRKGAAQRSSAPRLVTGNPRTKSEWLTRGVEVKRIAFLLRLVDSGCVCVSVPSV